MSFIGKISIYGGQRQEKREGYNKLDMSNAVGGTNAGITCTVNKDGTYSYVGTATNTQINVWLLGGYSSQTILFTLKAGIYTVKDIILYHNQNPLKNTFTLTEEIAITGVRAVSATSGQTYNEKKYPMLLEGEYTANTMPEYEPFGAMPSLQYPSEIQAVGDNVNLFNKDTAKSGYYITNGNLTTPDKNFLYQIIEVSGNSDISISGTSKTNKDIGIVQLDNTKNFIKALASYKDGTFKTETNCKYLGVSCRVVDRDTFKVEKGNKSTNYSQHGQGSVEITTSNKNVLDIQKNAHLEVSGLAIDTDENGEVTINGTATANTYLKLYDNELTNLNYTKWDKKKVAKGNWVFSSRMIKGEINAEANTSAYVRSATTGGTEYASLWRVLNAKEKKSQFVFEEDTDVVMYMWVGKDVTFNNVKLQFQLELDELSDYVEHRGQTLIMPIQQKMFEGDTFEKIDGVWYEKHGWREIILDGTQTISHLDSNIQNASQTRFAISIDNLILSKTFCNKLTAYPAGTVLWNGIYQNAVAIYIQNNINKVVLQVKIDYTLFTETIDSAAQKVVKFKEYLKENPITVVVPIKTEYIKCTAEQCKILDKIDTYRDGTIITTDNDLCKIQLRYKQDLEKRITALEKQIATQTVAESE